MLSTWQVERQSTSQCLLSCLCLLKDLALGLCVEMWNPQHLTYCQNLKEKEKNPHC